MSEGEGFDVPLTGDASGLIDAFSEAANAGADMASKLGHIGEDITESFKEVGAEIFKMASAFLVAQVGVEAFHKAMEAATEGMARARQIALDSSAIGATAEQYQKLAIAADEFGVSSEGMTMSMERLNVAIGRAVSDGGEAAQKFKDMGLNIKELKAMNPEERFKAIADAIAGMGDRTAQTEAAVSLFGRSGLRLVGLLADGAKGFDEVAEKAGKAGIILSNFDIAVVAELAKQSKDVDEKMEAASISIGERLGPAITSIKSMWVDFTADIYKTSSAFEDVAKAVVYVSAFIKNIAEAFVIVYELVKNASINLYDALSITFLEIGKAARIAAVFIWEKFKDASDAIRLAFVLLGDGLSVIWNLIRLGIGEAMSWAVDKVIYAMRVMSDGLSYLPGSDEMVAGIRDFANQAEEFSKQVANDVEAGMDKARQAVVEDTAAMGKAVDHLFTSGVDVDTSDIDEKIEKTLTELEDTDAAAEKANEALANLAVPWEAASEAVEKYKKSIEEARDAASKKGGGLSMGNEGGQVEESSPQAKAYLKEVQDAMVKTLTVTASAAAKEQAEYADRLTKFAEFYREKGLIAADAETAIAALSEEHQIKMTQAENQAEISRLKNDLSNSHIAVKQKEAALATLQRAENAAAEMATANALKAAQHQVAVLNEQEIKDRGADMKSMINYDEQRKLIMMNFEKEKQVIETTANKESVMAEQQLADEKMSIYQGGMSALGGVLGQAAALMDQHNRAQFTAWKVFASGQAVINALLSFSNIMGDPKVEFMFGPTGQIALAYTSLTLGMAAAAKIASTPFGGTGGAGGLGGGGGGGGGQGAAAAREMNPAQTNVNVSLYGSQVGADQVRGLIGLINQQQSQNLVVKMAN